MGLAVGEMKIVDTHAHMCDPAFAQDLSEVLSRARETGVRAIIAVSEDREDCLRTLELAKQYPLIKAALGLFPTCLELDAAGEVISLTRRERERVKAIGEVGLDFWKVKEASERQIQVEIFRRFIELSRELDLPLNVHRILRAVRPSQYSGPRK